MNNQKVDFIFFNMFFYNYLMNVIMYLIIKLWKKNFNTLKS